MAEAADVADVVDAAEGACDGFLLSELVLDCGCIIGISEGDFLISSSNRLRMVQRITHSTASSLPSPSVCHTAFSSDVLPVIAILNSFCLSLLVDFVILPN